MVLIAKKISTQFTIVMTDTRIISSEMLDKLKALGMPEVKENNPWLMLHIKGDDTKAPGSWNAKVYRNKAGILKVVTADMVVLDALLTNTAPFAPVSAPMEKKSERIVTIDDSGWGFPLMGVLIGAHDSQMGQIIIEEIKVEYFQSPYFETKAYLNQAAIATMRLLDRLNVSPDGTLIKICTGYIHTEAVRVLIENGYTIERGVIGEPLQSKLEAAHAEYVRKATNAGIYYDPKDLDKKEIGRKFHEVIAWIKKNNAWNIAKTGWGFFKKNI
ncbi:MAG TPA: hypothetical protein VN368_02250 [Candidatus Methylomirabilis sp.]|nr:hypothetical protein [Candidatus Methylomirabilis sp.]